MLIHWVLIPDSGSTDFDWWDIYEDTSIIDLLSSKWWTTEESGRLERRRG